MGDGLICGCGECRHVGGTCGLGMCLAQVTCYG